MAAGIDKMRREDVHIQGGYDGDYGVIRLFTQGERQELTRQARFWELPPENLSPPCEPVNSSNPDTFSVSEAAAPPLLPERLPSISALIDPWLQDLNPAQVAAVTHSGGPLLVQAGPGTGKTRTLTHRVAHLLHRGQVRPDQILAVTFTRQAAKEMAERLQQLLGREFAVGDLAIKTFHALGTPDPAKPWPRRPPGYFRRGTPPASPGSRPATRLRCQNPGLPHQPQ